MQVCGILAGKKVDEIENNVFKVSSRINSTWGGNLVDMVRSAKVMEIIESDNLCDNATNTGNYLYDNIIKLSNKYSKITNVRGRGLMCAFDLPTKDMRDKLIRLGMENNLMLLGCGNTSIRFRPALTIENKHVDEGMNTIEKIMNTL
jgi:L-lysine 6-transaminase